MGRAAAGVRARQLGAALAQPVSVTCSATSRADWPPSFPRGCFAGLDVHSSSSRPYYGSAAGWLRDSSPVSRRFAMAQHEGCGSTLAARTPGTLSALPSHSCNRPSSSCLVPGTSSTTWVRTSVFYAARCATRRPHGDGDRLRTRPPQRGGAALQYCAQRSCKRRGNRTGCIRQGLHAEICDR